MGQADFDRGNGFFQFEIKKNQKEKTFVTF